MSEHNKIVSSVINSMLNEIECKVDGFRKGSDIQIHLRNANIAPSDYKNDANFYEAVKGEAMSAVDMQKEIILP